MSDTKPTVLIDHAEWKAFFEELRKESDRAAAVLAAAWIDHLLQKKLEEVYAHGTSETRRDLFSGTGAFSTFAAKIAAAFCAGWLDSDVHHDLCVIRKVRNQFAHRIHGLSMESPEIRPLVESFRVPNREFYDWGNVRCAAAADGTGVVFYTDAPPEELGAPLVIPAGVTFRWAVAWAIAYLVANLGLGIVFGAPANGAGLSVDVDDSPDTDA